MWSVGVRQRRKPKTLADVEVSAPHWKDVLRAACVDRARKKRQELIRKKRYSRDYEETTLMQPLRSLVEEELRERGIGRFPWDPTAERNELEECCPREDAEGKDKTKEDVPMEWPEERNSEEEYEITEEILNELLQDIEEDIRNDEQMIMEEVLEAEESFVNDYVADYEAWESGKADDCLSDAVFCPMCQTSNIQMRPDNTITCAQASCGLCIDAGHINQPLCVLKEQLGATYQEHARYCGSPLTFSVSTRMGRRVLVGHCDCCALTNFFLVTAE